MQNQIIEYMGILLSLKKKSTKQCTAELVGKVKHEDIQKNQIGLIKYNCTLTIAHFFQKSMVHNLFPSCYVTF